MISEPQLEILRQIADGRRLRVHLSSATWQDTGEHPDPDDLIFLWPEYFSIVPGADEPPSSPFGWAVLTERGKAVS